MTLHLTKVHVSMICLTLFMCVAWFVTVITFIKRLIKRLLKYISKSKSSFHDWTTQVNDISKYIRGTLHNYYCKCLIISTLSIKGAFLNYVDKFAHCWPPTYLQLALEKEFFHCLDAYHWHFQLVLPTTYLVLST